MNDYIPREQYEKLTAWYKSAQAKAHATRQELEKVEQEFKDLRKKYNEIYQKLVYCAEELNHTGMILMGPLNYQIKDTNEGALELVKLYEELQQKYTKLLEDWEKTQTYKQSWTEAAKFWQRAYHAQGRENERLREGLHRICQTARDEYDARAMADDILDGYDVKEEEYLDSFIGMNPCETVYPEGKHDVGAGPLSTVQYQPRSAEIIWCPTCERYKDHYCEHIKYSNVKPCNAKYRGFFCAKPMGHEDLHKSCGGVEWSQAKPDETDK